MHGIVGISFGAPLVKRNSILRLPNELIIRRTILHAAARAGRMPIPAFRICRVALDPHPETARVREEIFVHLFDCEGASGEKFAVQGVAEAVVRTPA